MSTFNYGHAPHWFLSYIGFRFYSILTIEVRKKEEWVNEHEFEKKNNDTSTLFSKDEIMRDGNSY